MNENIKLKSVAAAVDLKKENNWTAILLSNKSGYSELLFWMMSATEQDTYTKLVFSNLIKEIKSKSKKIICGNAVRDFEDVAPKIYTEGNSLISLVKITTKPNSLVLDVNASDTFNTCVINGMLADFEANSIEVVDEYDYSDSLNSLGNIDGGNKSESNKIIDSNTYFENIEIGENTKKGSGGLLSWVLLSLVFMLGIIMIGSNGLDSLFFNLKLVLILVSFIYLGYCILDLIFNYFKHFYKRS